MRRVIGNPDDVQNAIRVAREVNDAAGKYWKAVCSPLLVVTAKSVYRDLGISQRAVGQD